MNWGASSTFTNLPDCQNNPYHNKWWTLATVTSPGTYRLQVTTTNPLNTNDQIGVSAENMWGLRAVSTDPTYQPRVYGLGKMVIYANVPNGQAGFYLGRIEAVHAGKTMVIQLFDPGDASGNSSIEILQPTATDYVPISFSYTADSNASGSKSGTDDQPQDDDQRRDPVQQLVGHDHRAAPEDATRLPSRRRSTPPGSSGAGGRSATRTHRRRRTRRPGRSPFAATRSISSCPEHRSASPRPGPDPRAAPIG